jgi:hypothetical protein
MDGFKRNSTPRRVGQPVSRPGVPPVYPRQVVTGGQVAPSTKPVQRSTQLTKLPAVAPGAGGEQTAPGDVPQPKPPRRRRRMLVWVIVVVSLALALGGVYLWFNYNLQPVDVNNTTTSRFEIKDGSTFEEISSQLEKRKLIRSALAFDIYARIQGKRGSLKASTCSLRSSMSARDVLNKLNQGCRDFVSIMFYPGATIEKPLYKPAGATIDQEKMHIKYVLKSAGFSDQDITTALKKQYDMPLFAGKPAGATLEGYIFGETYYIDKSATAEDVLKEAFSHMYNVVQKNDLVEKYRQKGLSLYQGITLASIVQRELNCEGKPTAERKNRCYEYQRTIAQVFLKRLKENIVLGSDVTFIYAGDMMKVNPSVDLDSPYNTRKYPGLPPGPIASPGELALKAVANPSETDYLYFIAGDDGLIYFAKDEAGHQKNIREHCQVMCGNAV